MYVRYVIKIKKNYGKTFLQAGRRLKGYVSDRQHIFATKTSNQFQKAQEYLKSLWLSRLTNLEKMSETGLPKIYHNLHHYISDSSWDGFKLIDSVSEEVSRSLPGRKPTKLKADIEPIDVHTYMKSLTRKSWQEIKVRNTAKGTLKGLYHFCTVYIWDEKSHHVKDVKFVKVELIFSSGIVIILNVHISNPITKWTSWHSNPPKSIYTFHKS